MKGQFTRLIVFLTVCVILIAGITAATYAVWTTSDGGSTPATTVTGEWEDESYRYLVLEAEFSDGTTTLVEYEIKADDGTDFEAFDAGEADVDQISHVKVVGYKGILTTLRIPSSVTLKGAGKTKEFTVDTIAAYNVEMYDGLLLVERLEIPLSVTVIEDYSFMLCANLTEVVFEAGSVPLTLGDKCFYKCAKLEESAVDFGGRPYTEGEYCFG